VCRQCDTHTLTHSHTHTLTHSTLCMECSERHIDDTHATHARHSGHSHAQHCVWSVPCECRQSDTQDSQDTHTLNIVLRIECIRPTQSVMYVPLQVNRFAESIVLIVQYRYLKSCSGDFYSPESDPPHKIMRYWFYYSVWLGFSFPPDRICQVEMICIGGVPVSKRHFGGAGP
jgi:hypothetical protein